MDETIQECPPERMGELIQAAGADDQRGLDMAERLLGDYGLDPRLHFLRGSLLASLRRYDEAREAMHRALEIAPGYAIARFQAGLLELTSGEPGPAQETWAQLQQLPQDNPLRLFAMGLTHLIRDEFVAAVALLREGIARNEEILPLNRDMQMLIDETQRKLAGETSDEAPTSAAQMLLQRFSKETKH